MAETDDSERPIFIGPEYSYMSVQGGGKHIIGNLYSPRVHEPVHEQMTVAALINSDYHLDASLTFYSLRDNPSWKPDINDFVRGALWNDDPQCLLFEEHSDYNLTYSTGAMWTTEFESGNFDFGKVQKPDLIRRSHFGDLQWLHSMGSQAGEHPATTKKLVLQWLEIMYSVAVGAMDPTTPLKATWLNEHFEDPTHYATLGELLTFKHKSQANVAHRALGSCFHILQDTYAIGHTRRELLNPSDKLEGHEIVFKPGVADRWGAIMNFHTYKGQSNDHSHYDHSNANVHDLDLTMIDSWNGLVGCRDGVDACIILANFWQRKAPWAEVYSWLDGQVFALSKYVTPSDNTV